MHDDSPDPALERAFVLKSVYVSKNLDERLLKHVLRILPIRRKPVTDTEHFGTELVVQFPLCRSIIFKTTGDEGLLRHEGRLIP